VIIWSDVLRVVYSIDGFANGLFYLPQIRKSWQDPYGTSLLSWAFWSFGTLDSLLYAIVIAKNTELALVMLVNVLGCSTVLIAAIIKRKNKNE
jgi:hypothetical protein